jgi:hypothetical protein
VSRALLFVQSGDARAKCVRRYAPAHEYTRKPERFASHLETFSEIKPMPYRDLRLAYEADRWWLVECCNADEGRFIIGGAPSGKVRKGLVPGRILASGVRQ